MLLLLLPPPPPPPPTLSTPLHPILWPISSMRTPGQMVRSGFLCSVGEGGRRYSDRVSHDHTYLCRVSSPPPPPSPSCFTPDPDQECMNALVDAAHHQLCKHGAPGRVRRRGGRGSICVDTAHHELREHGAPDRGRRRERRKERGEGDHGLTLPIGTQTGALVQGVRVPALVYRPSPPLTSVRVPLHW